MIKLFLRKILFVAVIITVMFQGICAFSKSDKKTETTDMPSIQVTGSYWFPMSQQVNYITPENGIDLETAKNLMTEELSKTEANTWSVDDLKEITVDEFWGNTNAQMFISEDSGYVGIIKNGSVICATGGGTMAVFISDINSDGVYDVCINSTFGYGWIDYHVNVFDVNNLTDYTLWDRMNAMYLLRIDETTKELRVYKNEVMIGNLAVADGKLTATEAWRYEENDPGKPVFPRTDEIHKNKLVVDIVDNSIVILLNGKTVEFTDALPFIDDNSRIQIPVRDIAQLMGYDVEWNGEKQTVTMKSESGNIIKLEIGSDVMKVNGEEVHMDTSAIIKDNRTYIPVRFIAEAIGYEVNWIC